MLEKCPLSERQLRCTRMLADGLHVKQIAHEMGVSYNAAMLCIKTARKRLKVGKETALVAAALRAGWID